MLLSFPPATEMFQFAGFASSSYGFTEGYRKKRWVAPFGHPRINERSPLPWAFRSVPRPSSPLGAKASTRCPSRTKLAHVQPQARQRRAWQRSDVRDQMAERSAPAIRPPPFLLISVLCFLFSEPGREPPGLAPWRQHTHVHKARCAAGPGSRPDQPAPRALRSRLSLHDVKIRDQMSEIRGRMSDVRGEAALAGTRPSDI